MRGSCCASVPSSSGNNALNGRSTAAAITLYGFLACSRWPCSPWLRRFLQSGNDNVAEDIVNWLGVTGTAAKVVTDAVEAASKSATVASVIGIVGLVWVGSSFAVAIAHAYNEAWAVPARVNFERLKGLGWLAGGGPPARGRRLHHRRANHAARARRSARPAVGRGRQHRAVAVDVVGPAQPAGCRGARCCPRRPRR